MRKRFLCVIMLIAIVCCFTACDVKTGPVLDSVARSKTYLVLVNKDHEIPKNWQETVLLFEVENSCGEYMFIEEETNEQFRLLQEELLTKGIQIEVNSAFRSISEQEVLYNEFAAKYGEEYTKQYLARPGFSEHHTGLAIDIMILKQSNILRDYEDLLADEEDFATIHELLPKYGFILRYPEGKEEATNHAYEPWHLRYIGDTEIATKIMNEGITLEEYLK